MSWYKKAQDETEKIKASLAELTSSLRSRYPVEQLDTWYSSVKGYIELASIRLPPEEQNKGIGHQIIQELQQFAQSVNKPIVLIPESQPRKKSALDRFYKDLGFVHNKGRKRNYQFSQPFAPTMYWTPE